MNNYLISEAIDDIAGSVYEGRGKRTKDFKSITSISCNLEGLRHVPCQVNLVGGGKDNSFKRMPSRNLLQS